MNKIKDTDFIISYMAPVFYTFVIKRSPLDQLLLCHTQWLNEFIVFQAVRELGETGGSNIRTVEKFISSSYDVELEKVNKWSLNWGVVVKNKILF